MTKRRRFPIDPEEAELVAEMDDREAPPTRTRPADKRWRRPHFDKSRPRPGTPSQGVTDGDDS